MGLRPRLLLAFLLVALVPLVALFIAVSAQTRQDTLASATATLEQVSRVQQRRLNLELARLTDLLALVASRTQMRISLDRHLSNGDPAHLELVERILRDALGPMPGLAGIWVRDPDGRLVTGVTAESRYPASEPRPPATAAATPLAVAWDAGGTPRLWLGGPLELEGRVIGSLHILASMDVLYAVLEDFPQATLGGRTLLLLGAADDQPLALHGRSAAAAPLPPELAAALRVAGASDGALELGQQLVRIRPLAFDLGRVMVSLDVGALEALLWRQTRLLLTLSALALVLSAAMALVLSRMIARPLEVLSRATRALHEGQAPAPIRERFWGEIDQLTRSFNYAMAVITRRTEALHREVEARRLSQQKLADLANTDTLTGLVNRRYFMDALGEVLKRPDRGGGPGALLYIDLDAFKPVNDRLGHEAGDIVLQAVAGRLRHLIRDRDLAARLGGDEFALLLAGDDGDGFDPEAVAQRAVEQLALPIAVKGRRLRVGCSVGVIRLTAGDTPQEALNRADAAMYREKARHHAITGT